MQPQQNGVQQHQQQQDQQDPGWQDTGSDDDFLDAWSEGSEDEVDELDIDYGSDDADEQLMQLLEDGTAAPQEQLQLPALPTPHLHQDQQQQHQQPAENNVEDVEQQQMLQLLQQIDPDNHMLHRLLRRLRWQMQATADGAAEAVATLEGSSAGSSSAGSSGSMSDDEADESEEAEQGRPGVVCAQKSALCLVHSRLGSQSSCHIVAATACQWISCSNLRCFVIVRSNRHLSAIRRTAANAVARRQ